MRSKEDISGFTEYDVIRWLQSYKGYLQRLLGYSVHLYISQQGDISWEKKEASPKFDDILVSKSVQGLPLFDVQYRAGLVVDIVDGWLQILNNNELKAVFMRYINHDFEKPKSFYEETVFCERGIMKYKTVSFRRIAVFCGVDKKTIYESIRHSLEKILLHIDNSPAL